jgi:GxxExxY protein
MDANRGGIWRRTERRAAIVLKINPEGSVLNTQLYNVILLSMNQGTAREVIFRKEVYAIVGAALEVLRELGHGIHEKPYERALAVELGLRGLSFEQQTPFEIIYKTVNVGRFTADLVVLGKIIVDTKVIDRITHHERG